MNIPNILSIVRIALIPVFVVLFFLPFPFMRFAALGVFLLASLTDMLDGYLARKLKQITKIGTFLDAIADKMLITCALFSVTISLTIVGIVDGRFWSSVTNYFTWESVFLIVVLACTIIITCREFIISGLRSIAQARGITIAADKLGKFKMIFQVIAIVFLIPHYDISGLNDLAGIIALSIGSLMLLVATMFTLVSAINYLTKYRNVFSVKEEQKLAQKEKEEDISACHVNIENQEAPPSQETNS